MSELKLEVGKKYVCVDESVRAIAFKRNNSFLSLGVTASGYPDDTRWWHDESGMVKLFTPDHPKSFVREYTEPPTGEWVDADPSQIRLSDFPIERARVRDTVYEQWRETELRGFFRDIAPWQTEPDSSGWRYAQIWRPFNKGE